jgi:hypothetical protein
MEQENLIHKWWSIHLAVLDQLWEKVVLWIGKSQENGKKEILLLLGSAAANTLSILLSIKQKKDQWTEEDSKNLPVSVYPVKKINEELKRKRLKPTLLQNFPASTLYLLQEQGCPWQWGRLWLVRAWHEEIWWIIHSNQEQ